MRERGIRHYGQPLLKCLMVDLLTAILLLSVVPAKLRPDTGAPHDSEHGVIFAFLGAAMVLRYRMRIWIWIILGPLFAAAIEVIQIGIPDRHARLEDFLVDAGTILLGSGCATLLLKIDCLMPPG